MKDVIWVSDYQRIPHYEAQGYVTQDWVTWFGTRYARMERPIAWRPLPPIAQI